MTTDKINKLDSVFSQYIRLRDSRIYGFEYFRCISCGAVLPFEHADCGHYVKRSNMATRFDEENCHAQCIYCNRFRQGNTENFRKNLVKKLGEEKVEELERKGRGVAKFSSGDIDDMISYYKDKVKELKKC